MKFFSRIAVCFVLFTAVGFTALADELHISGKVFMNEGERTVPGDFVMIYIKTLGMGTLSDQDGNYSISIPSGKARSSVELEFSHIGYNIAYRSVNLVQTDTSALVLEDVILQPQTLMLTAAYVTPDGMSPVQFLIKKVHENALKARKQKPTYTAHINYDFSTHEIPVLAEVLSGGQKGLTKFAGTLMGVGPLVKYCLENDDIRAKGQLTNTVTKGKTVHSGESITDSNPYPLPNNVQKNIKDFARRIDLMDLLYKDAHNMWHSFAQNHEFKLEGTYEYGDRLVDVISYSTRGRMSIKVHIVEEDWAILKMQVIRSGSEMLRAESRMTDAGIYMPVSFVMNPGIMEVDYQKIPGLIKFVQNEKRFKKAGKQRMIKILQERYDAKQSFNPYLAVGASVRYE